MYHPKRILIVDDDLDFSQALQNILETRGYSVETASDSTEALNKLESCKPDLLLLDVMMSYDNEGFKFAQKLKEDIKHSHIPIIIITGIRKAKNLPFYFEPDPEWLPVKAVIEKPIKIEELLSAIDKTLKD